MKNLYIAIVGLLTAWMLLAGCSADGLQEEGQQGGSIPTGLCSEPYYVNLHIVNSTAVTRATEAATSAENAIYDGILCIFEGESESTATLRTATVIDQLINNSASNTASVDVTQRLAQGTHAYGGHLYVLALLNTTSTGFTVDGTTLQLNGASLANATISTVQSQVVGSVGSTDEHVGLFMSNAPQDGYIMPEITSTYLYDTPEEAVSGSHLTIQVERAAAKVRVTDATTKLTDIRLNPRSSDTGDRNPSVHQMTWTLNNYNTQSYAIRTGSTAAANWATSVNALTTLTAKDFSLYPQQSHSQDIVYIGENTTGTDTEVIVEVQLKDNNNMLIHEGFVFRPFHDSFVENAYTDIYTSAEQYIAYLRDELPPGNKAAFGLGTVDNAAIFKYATVTVDDDGTVTITLVNSDLTDSEQTGLTNLAAFLSSHSTGFRDGKMYYTYKIRHDGTHTYGVVRNNAYNLTLQNTSISKVGRPCP